MISAIRDLPSAAIPMVLDMAIKGIILLCAAAIVTVALRRSSAALRHLVWALTMVGLLTLPLFSAVLPQWRILPRWSITRTNHETIAGPIETRPPAKASASHARVVERASLPSSPALLVPSTNTAVAAPTSPEASRPWTDWLLFLWAGVVLLLLVRLLLCRAALWRLGRSSQRITEGTWTELLTEVARHLRLVRPIRLLQSNKPLMPMAWGVLRTRILLPGQAVGWVPERRRAVLLHELAHVRRRDCLTQLLTNLACALHWFNPFVWIVRRRMTTECERACDDLVLTAGLRPSEYAEHLVEIATAHRGNRPFVSVVAIAMARPSKLEGRLTALLDATICRRGATRMAILAGALIALTFATPLAVLRAEQPGDRESIELRFILPPGIEAPLKAEISLDLVSVPPVVTGTEAPSRWSHGSYSNGRSLDVPYKVPRVPWGRVAGHVYVKGFVPVIIGPVTHTAETPCKSIDVPLRAGGKAIIRLVDGDGVPVKRASAKASLQQVNGIDLRSLGIHGGECPLSTKKSDAQGRVIFSDVPMGAVAWVQVEAEGFEHNTFRDVALVPGEPGEIALKRAVPVTGRVVDAARNPVANARVSFISYVWAGEGKEPQGYYPSGLQNGSPGLSWAITDAKGLFSINRLRGRGWQYTFFVRGNGHQQPSIIGPVQAGDDLGVIQLDTPIVLSGAIQDGRGMDIKQSYGGDGGMALKLAPGTRRKTENGFTFAVNSAQGLRRGPVEIQVYFERDWHPKDLKPVEQPGPDGTVVRYLDPVTRSTAYLVYKTELKGSITGLRISPKGVRREPACAYQLVRRYPWRGEEYRWRIDCPEGLRIVESWEQTDGTGHTNNNIKSPAFPAGAQVEIKIVIGREQGGRIRFDVTGHGSADDGMNGGYGFVPTLNGNGIPPKGRFEITSFGELGEITTSGTKLLEAQWKLGKDVIMTCTYRVKAVPVKPAQARTPGE